jgi:prepilin-type N-terminal cleavage/methylation domain-containing protein
LDFGLWTSSAFTLIEMLMVIAIMGIIAAIALPSLRSMKPNAKIAGTRQLLDAVGRARQLAITQRTTVYMVFLSTNFWTDPAYGVNWTNNDYTAVSNLFDKQTLAYNYVVTRSVGDQPGVSYPHYLSAWKTLPSGAFIPLAKFTPTYPNSLPVLDIYTNGNPNPAYKIFGFSYTTNVPFPLETTRSATTAQPYVALPYIAFDGTGALVSSQNGLPEMIPISEGSVSFARNPITKVAQPQPPQALEQPLGNTVSNYSLVYIDRLTGRARVQRMTVQ